MTHLYSPTIRISRFIHINRSCQPLIARLLQGCHRSKPIPFKVFLAFEAKKQPCTSLANNQSFSLKNALPFCYLLKWNKIGHFDNREGSTFRSINQAKIMVVRDSQPKKGKKRKKNVKRKLRITFSRMQSKFTKRMSLHPLQASTKCTRHS